MVKAETCLMVLIAWVARASGSHFRGAIIMWKPTDVENQVEVTYRIAWRRSYTSSSRLYCDQRTIQNRQELYEGSSDLQCLAGCGGSLGGMKFYCTDFSINEDWTAGQYSKLITFPKTQSQVFKFGYQGQAWIKLQNGGDNWSLVAKANLTIRSDKGKVNSSPTSTISPIVRVIKNCNRSIAIPVSDEDGDVVRCRWAKSYYTNVDECGGVCQHMTGATLNESTCVIHLSATGSAGTSAIAIQIEDFIDQNSYTALSSVPAQFLVVVTASSEPCDTKPKFIYPTPHDHSCIGIPFNETYSDVIIAEDRLPGKEIQEIKTTSPEGLFKSDLGQYNHSSDVWYVNITYTPTRAQRGQQHFCFAALDVDSIESDRRCIQLNVGVSPPTVVSGTQVPQGNIRPFKDTSFSAEFDQPIYRPPSTTYIYVYEVNGTLLQKLNVATDRNVHFQRQKLTFDTAFTVQEKKRYYVLFDRGVVVGNFYQNCRVESRPVLDPTSWQMRIRDVTPPVLTEIHYPQVSTGDIQITWRFSEEVTTRCALQSPNGSTSAVSCTNSWKANNLSEGYYYFSIVGTDMEDNLGKLKQVIWKVDRTPPNIDFFINVPNEVTNKTSVEIFFECDEKCYANSTLEPSAAGRSPIRCVTSISAPDAYSVANWIRVQCKQLVGNTSYILKSLVTDEAGNMKIATTKKFFTDFFHPNIHVDDYRSKCGQAISPNTTGYPNVTDNYNVSLVTYDDKAWKGGECAIQRTWSATDMAGNVFEKQQKIYIDAGTISNIRIHGLPPTVVVACGDLQYATDRFIANNITVNHPCNLPCSITYSDPKEAHLCDSRFTRTWTATDPCGTSVTATMIIVVLPQQPPKFPKDGQTNIDIDYPLQWPDYPGAVRFKIYLWQYNTKRPSSPYAITYSKYYRPYPRLTPGQKYSWQVEYVLRSNEVVPSQRWAFVTRTFSDLVIKEIITPPTAYSGGSFDVKWTVENIGGTVPDSYSWTDAVYVGFTKDFNTARMAARQSETNVLFPNDTYTLQATVTLGQAEFGALSVFVYVNDGNSFYELNKTNNMQKSRQLVDVLLIPPPDLQVSSIAVPRHTISDGQEIITWTVINNGYGVTKEESWTDMAYLSTDTNFDRGDTFLASYHRIGILEPSEEYSVTTEVRIPRDISGEYFILVWVDKYNSVFEHMNDGNNIGSSSNISVALRPPPDLSISSLTTTADVSTGDILHVSWSVTNIGQRAPYSTYWTDVVYISSDNWSIGSRRFLGNLNPSTSYSSDIKYTIPPRITSGKYNITVKVDHYQNVFENGQIENNVQTKEINVQRKLPDLCLTLNLSTLVQIDGENGLNVSWSVTNLGNGRIKNWVWTDRIEIYNYEISNWPIFEENVYIEDQRNTEYTKTQVLRLPRNVHGNVTVKVIADVLSYTSDEYLDNNQKSTIITIPLVATDFVLTDAKIPLITYASGDTVTVSLTLRNNGNRNNYPWFNEVYLSYSPFPTEKYLTSVVQTQRNILQQGQIYAWRTHFIIPDNVVGKAFIHCNVSSSIQEITRGGSRDKHIVIPIIIKPPLSPDLVIEFGEPLSKQHLSMGDTLTLYWTVHNRGNSMIKEMKWQDLAILWKNPLDNYTIGHFPKMLQLETNGAYFMSKAAILTNVTQGTYNVCITTDAYNTVREFSNEENNMICTERIITIMPDKIAELNISTKLDVNYNIFPGALVPFSFTVSNIGQAATASTSWNDMIYLSDVPLEEMLSDAVSNRVLLKQISHIGQLFPLESYTVNVTLRIPNFWNFDSAYLSVVHDSFISEYVSSNALQEATIVQTSFSRVSSNDLYPEVSDTYIDTTGGQPFNIIYNVTFIGESKSKERFDAIVLSEDVEVDPFDRRLKTTQEDSISANNTIQCNTTVFLPYDLETKTYFVIVVVDVSNEIYEYDEDNNQAILPLTIKETMSTDLAVQSIDAPVHAEYNEDIDIKWTIRNNGTKTATGYKCDSVFFSLDDNLDVYDQEFGNPVCSAVSIQPYMTAHKDMQFSLESVVPLIAEQNYTVIVKTRSNIPDAKQKNNIAASNSITSVTVETIDLGTKTIISMRAKKKPLRIPDVPSGEAMIISTKSMNNSFFHSVKVRSGSPATDYAFDVATENPLLLNQITSVPDTSFGDYYLLIEYTGNENELPNSDFIEIYAKLAKFEITGSSPRRAAPLGNVTLKIEGSLFNEVDTVMLQGASRVLYAEEIYRFTSTLLYATFDITGLNISDRFSLHVRSRFYTNAAVLLDALTILSGSEGRIMSRIALPSSLAQGQRTLMYVDLENVGDTDVLVPLLSVVAKGVGKLKLITETNEYDYQDNYVILGTPSHGLGGIYQPRQVSRLIFDVRPTFSSGRLEVEVGILHPKNDVSHFYVPLKTQLKYSHYDDMAWDGIWKQFMDNVGNSTHSFNTKLSMVSNKLSEVGKRVYSFNKIADTLIDMSDKRVVEDYLFQHTDFRSSATDIDAKIVIERKYSTRLGFRHSMGSFGRGWISTLWDTKLKDISPEIAQLTVDKTDYYMFAYQAGKYKSKNLGTLQYMNNDTIILKKEEKELEYTFSVSNGSLTSIRASSDGSWLKLIYNNRRLVNITSSSGAYVEILYDAENRVVSMNINNEGNNAPHSIVYHYDATGCLDAVYSGFGRILYRYNENNAPVLISYEDGKEDRIVYDMNGYLKSISEYHGETLENTISYAYDGATSITKSVEPQSSHVTYTFDENREVVSRKRKGFLIQKWNRQPNSETIYEDNMVIYKRTIDIRNRILHLEDANGDGLTVTFNEAGQMISMLDGNDNRYEIRRNQSGTVMEIVFPDTSIAHYNYTDRHITMQNHAGHNVKYETDGNGRVILDDIGDDNPILYSYGEGGELQSARNNLGEISVTHNDKKRPVGVNYETSNGDSRILYEMNEQSLCTGMKAFDSYDVQYVYDDHQKLTKVVDRSSSTVLLTVQYDGMGRLSKKTLGNNATTMYKYDNTTGLLLSLTNTFPNGSIASKFDYTYNIRLRIVNMETIEGTWKFRYDNAGQVTYIERPDGHKTIYSYDRSKNRKYVEVNGQRKQYFVNSMNQYTSLDDSQFTYDKNGNLVGKNGKPDTHFAFDQRNKLTGLNISNNSCSFKYDALGNIYSKRCGNRTTTFFINPYGQFGQDILSENDEISQETVQYFYGANQLGLLAMKRRGKFYYYQFDPLGSAKTLLAENGDAVNTYQYDPFGGLITSTEKIRNPFKFVGQWGVLNIDDTEIYFMRARVYDCDIGRFLSLDPNGLFGQSKNFYAYAFNNPVQFRDPKGTIPFLNILLGPEGMLMGGVISVVEDSAVKLLTGKKLTLGGAASAFVSGAISGPLGNIAKDVKYGKMIAKVGANIISGAAGSLTENLIDKHKLDISSLSPVSIMGNLISDSCPANKVLNSICKIGLGIDGTAIDDQLHNANLPKMMSKFENDVSNQLNRAGHALTDAAKKAADLASNAVDKLHNEMDRLDLRMLWWLTYLSMDPNNLIGPPGYGAAKFIRKDQQLEYTIQFENEANATGPAQRVYIEHKLDQKLEPMTLQIKKFGFGNMEFVLQEYKAFVYMLIDLTSNKTLYLRVHGGLNDDKNMFTMEFKTIDPLTGDVPEDPRIGFLPPNNGTSGQGYVTFSIKLRPQTTTLSRIIAKSTVFFDNNLPILTPEVANTVDDSYPEINVTVIEELLTSGILAISLQTFDLGSGFKEADIYVKQESMFKILMSSVKDKIAILPLEEGFNYEIAVVPVDNVGNRNDSQLVEQTTQATISIFYTTVNYSCPKIKDCSGNGKCVGPNICVCNEGHFGSDCSSTVKPLDPPIVEVTVEGHTQGHPIILRITLEFPSGTPDSFYTTLVGVPNDAQVQNGLRISPGVVLLPGNILDYLLLRMPATYYGQFGINVTAFAQYGKSIVSKSVHTDILLNKEEVNINLEAVPSCYRKHIACANNSFELKFNISQDIINKTDVINVAIPKECEVTAGQFITFGFYSLNIIQDHVIPDIEVNCRNAELSTFIVGVTLSGEALGNSSLHAETIIEDCKDEPVCPEIPTTTSIERISQMHTTKSKHYDSRTTQAPNTGLTPKKNERTFDLQLELSYNISRSLNFTDTSAGWYKQLKGNVKGTLTNAYQNVQGFVRVDILSMRRGSLIVDYDVITDEGLSTSSDMAETIRNIMQDKIPLKLGNTSVVAQSIQVKDKEGNTHKITKDEVKDSCKVLQAIAPCGASSQCIVKNNKPVCVIQVKVVPDTNTNLQPLKIATATLACVLLLTIVGVVIFACVKVKKKRSKARQERLPGEFSNRFSNAAYEDISTKSVEDLSDPEETKYDLSSRRKAEDTNNEHSVNRRYVFENKNYKPPAESSRDDMDHRYRVGYDSSLRMEDKGVMETHRENYSDAYSNIKMKIPRPSVRQTSRQQNAGFYDDDNIEKRD